MRNVFACNLKHMLKKVIATCFVLLMLGHSVNAQTGQNSFNTEFHNDADHFDLNHAYLLGYLTTMAYAQYLRYWRMTTVAPFGGIDTSLRMTARSQRPWARA